MKETFNVEFLKENSGCYREIKGKLKGVFLSNGKTCFEEAGECQITLEEIMSSNIPTEDKYWFLSNVVLDLKERKELFLLVMHAVSEATEDITIKEYIATIIRYAAGEVSYDTLYEAYRKTPRVGWITCGCGCYYDSYCLRLGFGLYQIYTLLYFLNKDKNTREVVWGVVLNYINSK